MIGLAKGIVEGRFKNTDAIRSFAEQERRSQERVAQGKAKVGKETRYSDWWISVCQVMQITSPAAYRQFRAKFGGPHPRNLKRRRAKQPRFRLGIHPDNFEECRKMLQAIKYDGPLNVGFDDTVLRPEKQSYLVREGEGKDQVERHFLVGLPGEPIEVLSYEELQQMLEELSADSEATKVCSSLPIAVLGLNLCA